WRGKKKTFNPLAVSCPCNACAIMSSFTRKEIATSYGGCGAETGTTTLFDLDMLRPPLCGRCRDAKPWAQLCPAPIPSPAHSASPCCQSRVMYPGAQPEDPVEAPCERPCA